MRRRAWPIRAVAGANRGMLAVAGVVSWPFILIPILGRVPTIRFGLALILVYGTVLLWVAGFIGAMTFIVMGYSPEEIPDALDGLFK